MYHQKAIQQVHHELYLKGTQAFNKLYLHLKSKHRQRSNDLDYPLFHSWSLLIFEEDKNTEKHLAICTHSEYILSSSLASIANNTKIPPTLYLHTKSISYAFYLCLHIILGHNPAFILGIFNNITLHNMFLYKGTDQTKV